MNQQDNKKEQDLKDQNIKLKAFNSKELKENLPTLYKELNKEKWIDLKSSEVINSLEDDQDQEIEKQLDVKPQIIEKDYLKGFNPQVVDFIRRATSEEQAFEVISYLEARGELDINLADNLRSQLEKLGIEKLVEKLGGFKKHGFYFEYQRERHLQEKMQLSKKINKNE